MGGQIVPGGAVFDAEGWYHVTHQSGVPMTKSLPEVDALLEMVDQAFDKRAWHGTNLKGSLRGITATEAARRPGKGRHNIWELTVHAAYWKYTVIRRIRGEKRGSFALKGSNWFARPASGTSDEKAWKQDVALLMSTHKTLREAVAALSKAELRKTPPGSRINIHDLVVGIAAHDLYHTGQIQLIKKLMP